MSWSQANQKALVYGYYVYRSVAPYHVAFSEDKPYDFLRGLLQAVLQKVFTGMIVKPVESLFSTLIFITDYKYTGTSINIFTVSVKLVCFV